MKETSEFVKEQYFDKIEELDLVRGLSDLVENFEEFNGSGDFRESQFCRQSIWTIQDNRKEFIRALRKNDKKYLMTVCSQLLRFVLDCEFLASFTNPSLSEFTEEIENVFRVYFLSSGKKDIEKCILEMRTVFSKYKPV